MTKTGDDSDPVRACVIGWPIEHSRSPLIHGAWLKQYGIAGSYTKESVASADLPAFVARMREGGGFTGCNVTVPHKSAVLELVDEVAPVAEAIGAANTLWRQDGQVHATNTDAAGFMAHLQSSAPDLDIRRAPVVVLGAGGAARAIVYGLVAAGAPEVLVFNRTQARATALATHFGAPVKGFGWQKVQAHLRDAGLLVNTTSLGMTGHDPLPIDLGPLPGTAIVADIVYAPLETALLAAARARGLVGVDGLGMLLHQAVPGFERWFGVRPDVTDALRRLVVADLERV